MVKNLQTKDDFERHHFHLLEDLKLELAQFLLEFKVFFEENLGFRKKSHFRSQTQSSVIANPSIGTETSLARSEESFYYPESGPLVENAQNQNFRNEPSPESIHQILALKRFKNKSVMTHPADHDAQIEKNKKSSKKSKKRKTGFLTYGSKLDLRKVYLRITNSPCSRIYVDQNLRWTSFVGKNSKNYLCYSLSTRKDQKSMYQIVSNGSAGEWKVFDFEFGSKFKSHKKFKKCEFEFF